MPRKKKSSWGRPRKKGSQNRRRPGRAGRAGAGTGKSGSTSPQTGTPQPGTPEAGPLQVGPQAGPPQAGPPQAGPPQAVPPQAGPPEAGTPQAGLRRSARTRAPRQLFVPPHDGTRRDTGDYEHDSSLPSLSQDARQNRKPSNTRSANQTDIPYHGHPSARKSVPDTSSATPTGQGRPSARKSAPGTSSATSIGQGRPSARKSAPGTSFATSTAQVETPVERPNPGHAVGISMPDQERTNRETRYPHLTSTVIDYLAKKGYSRTEAMLRMESANQEIDGRPLPPMGEDSRPKYKQGFDLLKAWVEDNLDLYKPELRRVLWPLFVYSFLNMVTSLWQQEAKQFFESSKNMFLPEHTDDIRNFEPISLPEHAQHNDLAVLYRSHKYRIVLSIPAYQNLLQFLESKEKEGGSVMNAILSSYCTVKTMERAADDRFSFATMLGQTSSDQSVPMEDEGIPGHHPGSAYTGDNPAMAGTLPRLRLGKMPMEPTMEGDVRHELAQLDAMEPPPPGRNTLLNEFEQMIKREDDEESPNRTDVPFPPSTARDVGVEVKKVQEHRDRFQIPARTGGVAPGVSVCMFTLHNTYDSVNCIDISNDNTLIAAGFDQSFIRVWSLDGKNIKPAYPHLDKTPPANSHRLVGHSGPVYAVAFHDCATAQENVDPNSPDYNPTNPRWLLSASEDKTIRLWFLDTWQCIVAYKGHDRPVFDVRWGPFGHYFVSGGCDRAARLWVTDHIRQRRMFVGHEQDVDCVCFHPNSAYVFTASSDKSVRMWAITTGNAVRMFTGHTGPITALECSPNGKILASADTQGSIFLWDLAPGRLLKQMRGHGKGGIWSLSFSAESTALVSGGADGTVRVWDVTGPQDSTQGRVVNDGAAISKIDVSSTAAGSSGQAKKKKGKDVVVSPDQISAFPTKKTPVYKVKFTTMNLVVAAGAYLP
ncbi:hypothetical protein N7493_007444 [Penicillium malachiteum]|uniref:TFIID subunit TAF5 NTD2 domain-containing protein n=1 Tax=Penicillium malachiteum TaxID=1324776 RepID=A0AAD6MU80_9EURO|nr:hypothetical protein N7493_007444 [Penicillium malachiteum]